MLSSFEITRHKQRQLSEQKLLQEATAHFDNMVVTRSWSAMYGGVYVKQNAGLNPCLLYTSPSPRDRTRSRMPSSA